MKVVRTVRKSDLDGLLALATQVGRGMTSLKPDKKALSHRILVAADSFAEKNSLEERDYVFVMEETDTQEIVGVCAIRSRVGLDEPFYNFRLGRLIHSSKELGIYNPMVTLSLSNDLSGCSEMCSLFLLPEHRTRSNGKFLSKSRCLFIAQFSHLFSEKLIAELRGFQRADGSSPFWDHLGRHFFQMEFSQADDLSSKGKKSFIAELMPHYPLYAKYLAQEAQDAIGKVHVDTEPARHLLLEEGFSFEGYIDIFDGGPVLQAKARELRSYYGSKLFEVVDFPKTNLVSPIEPVLVSNTDMHNFRVIVSETSVSEGLLPLLTEQQRALHCSASTHAKVRAMTLNVGKQRHG